MLNEEVKRYRELSGDNNPNTPISRIGGYLDGYEKAMEQRTGKWIKAKPWMLDNTSYKWECSECEKSERFRHNYCPNCGAKME